MAFLRKHLLTPNLKQRAGFKSNDLVTLLSTPKMVSSLWKTHDEFQNVHTHTHTHTYMCVSAAPPMSKPKFLVLNVSVPAIFSFIITEKKKHINTFINI
jgi:hypothetical protein